MAPVVQSIRTDVRGAKKQHSRVVSSPLSISASPGTSSAALNDAGAAAAQSEAAEGAPSERQRKKKRRHSAMTMTAAAAAADEDEDEDEGPFAAGGQASSSQARKGSAAAAVSEPKPAATAAAANKSKTAAAAGGRGTSDEHAPASSAVGNKHDVPIESIMAGIAHSASERKCVCVPPSLAPVCRSLTRESAAQADLGTTSRSIAKWSA